MLCDRKSTHRNTENILAIFPMARILFLMTSFLAAAALAAKPTAKYRVLIYQNNKTTVFTIKRFILSSVTSHRHRFPLRRSRVHHLSRCSKRWPASPSLSQTEEGLFIVLFLRCQIDQNKVTHQREGAPVTLSMYFKVNCSALMWSSFFYTFDCRKISSGFISSESQRRHKILLSFFLLRFPYCGATMWPDSTPAG